MLTTECYKILIIFPNGLSHQGTGEEEDWGQKGRLPQLWKGTGKDGLGQFLLCWGRHPGVGSWDPGIPGFLCLAVTLGNILEGLSFPVCRRWPWAAMVSEVVSHKLRLIMANHIEFSTVMK